MTNEYFQHTAEFAKKIHEPLQALTDLNVKTWQECMYAPHLDLTNLKKPEDLFAQQVALGVASGRKALEYMKKAIDILEDSMNGLVQEAKPKKGNKSTEH